MSLNAVSENDEVIIRLLNTKTNLASNFNFISS